MQSGSARATVTPLRPKQKPQLPSYMDPLGNLQQATTTAEDAGLSKNGHAPAPIAYRIQKRDIKLSILCLCLDLESHSNLRTWIPIEKVPADAVTRTNPKKQVQRRCQTGSHLHICMCVYIYMSVHVYMIYIYLYMCI